MSRTVLVASSPIVAHTLNATPIVRNLLASGARVLWYVTPGLEAYPRQWVGDDVVPMDPMAAAAAQATGTGGPLASLAGVRDFYLHALATPARQHVEALTRVASDERVDLLVSDTLMLAAGVVAEATGVPWATIGDGPLQWPDPQVPPFGTGLPWMGGPAGRHRNRTVKRVVDQLLFSSALEELNRVRCDAGLWPVADLLTAGVSRDLHLQGCVPSFEHPRDHWPEHVRFVGALGPGSGQAPPVPEELRRGHRGRPLAFVSQGTRRRDPAELVDPAIDVLLDEGFDVLVAGVAPSGAPRPGVVIADRVDYPDALQEADLFVTNGGYTGVTLALAAGTPVVQCGVTEEKADIGQRLRACGAGESIPLVRPPRKVLRRAVRRVHSDAHRRAQRRLADEFAAHDTDRLVTAHLTALLDRSRHA